MKQSLLWRGVLIVAIATSAILSSYPLSEKLNLGLDLRGGTHLVLRVKTLDAVRAEAGNDMDRVMVDLTDADVAGVTGERDQDDSFVLRGVPASADGKVRDLDLQGWDWSRRGAELRFTMTSPYRGDIERLAVEQALETIRNRVDAFGVSEPVIQRQGLDSDRLVVQLPGVDDPERIKELIKNTAFLEFRMVSYPPNGDTPPASSREEVLANFGGQLPSQLEIKTQIIRDDQDRKVGEAYFAVEKRQVVTGRDLKGARPGLGQFNQPVVNFNLTHEGGKKFGEATGANVGRRLAIVLDGKVVSAPNINSRISDSGLIEGGFDQRQVEDLATVLRSGALPAGIEYLEERSVGPSLGQDSIDKGLRAGMIGAGIMVLLMVVVYKLTGINAILALSLNIALIFAALSYFGATLTLPGIAGIVLTIGMAVDANVLVFERIREELRAGRTVKAAVDAGFSKALSSIVDANITTLIAALFLFQFGTGPIRGFAVTLSVGILASMFTAIVVSRWIFDLILSRQRSVKRLSI